MSHDADEALLDRTWLDERQRRISTEVAAEQEPAPQWAPGYDGPRWQSWRDHGVNRTGRNKQMTAAQTVDFEKQKTAPSRARGGEKP